MKVAIFGKRWQTASIDRIELLFAELRRRGVETMVDKTFYEYLVTIMPRKPVVDGFIEGNDFEADVVLSVGGDGTFLNTARRVGRKPCPIAGINTGHLGYLSASDGSDMVTLIDDLMEGRYQVEQRSQLAIHTDGFTFEHPYALNEIAIMKRDVSAMLRFDVSVNGEYLNYYQADGLLLSTATGSTAYSLSVGGPVLMPLTDSFIMVPIAPHSLTVRPLVLDAASCVDIQVESRSRTCLISPDGRNNDVPTPISLRIDKADFTMGIVRRGGQTFVKTLRAKMMWGKDVRKGLSYAE